MPNASPVPSGYHTVTPHMTFKDTRQAIAFYQRAFGAAALELFPTPDGRATMHAQMKIGDSIFMMGDEMPGQECKSAETLGASPVGFYLYVPDADAAFKKAVDAGAKVTMPLADAFWGDRCGTVADPFGYSWTIGTHQRDLSADQIQQGAKAFCEQMAAQAGKR